MARITFDDLSQVREKHKNERIVFCSGGFDLTHAGHVLFFEDCKNQGNVLVVMVGEDKTLRRKGSERPVLNEHIRMKMVDSLKPVDYTIIDDLGAPDKHSLYAIDLALGELKPDVYVINVDAFDIPYRQTLAEKHGTELIILERSCPDEFDKISTTGIIKKIKGLD